MSISAREAAFAALSAFRRSGVFPGVTLEGKSDKLADARDAALATQLTQGVLRNTALCDYYIAAFSSVRLNRIEPKVLDILRLSVYQLAFLRIPASAAVNEGVALVKKHAGERAVSFANALLRRAAANAGKLPEVKAASERERLSILYSHPLWLVDALGGDGALLRANNEPPPVTARVNTLKTDAASALESLRADGVSAEPHTVLSDFIELRGMGRLERLEAFRKGYIYIQDPGAYLAAAACGVKPGDTVIDGCAAPGGKSFALALAMQNSGKILACDLPKKIRRIEDGARRLGLGVITAYARDAREYVPEWDGSADVVLADAPCSGFGVIRRKPEIRYKTEGELAGLPEIQRAILGNLSRYVKPGGVLLYATCTPLRRENEDVIEDFLRGSDFEKRDMITLLPHIHHTDGFFICKLRRNA
ncbi:MAG: 16S rRNA (cytosine(967)-C(5))-methyltransferase RsmB [Oscillospiraceae bacterium]|jgi:16S rRNA (cytosine967-C5)-methyltransferase|nr:16S rRNA (cytosine(967)-C(5))-methyltransferase RsmB [Oscillospiraceae bacterium]